MESHTTIRKRGVLIFKIIPNTSMISPIAPPLLLPSSCAICSKSSSNAWRTISSSSDSCSSLMTTLWASAGGSSWLRASSMTISSSSWMTSTSSRVSPPWTSPSWFTSPLKISPLLIARLNSSSYRTFICSPRCCKVSMARFKFASCTTFNLSLRSSCLLKTSNAFCNTSTNCVFGSLPILRCNSFKYPSSRTTHSLSTNNAMWIIIPTKMYLTPLKYVWLRNFRNFSNASCDAVVFWASSSMSKLPKYNASRKVGLFTGNLPSIAQVYTRPQNFQNIGTCMMMHSTYKNIHMLLTTVFDATCTNLLQTSGKGIILGMFGS